MYKYWLPWVTCFQMKDHMIMFVSFNFSIYLSGGTPWFSMFFKTKCKTWNVQNKRLWMTKALKIFIRNNHFLFPQSKPLVPKPRRKEFSKAAGQETERNNDEEYCCLKLQRSSLRVKRRMPRELSKIQAQLFPVELSMWPNIFYYSAAKWATCLVMRAPKCVSVLQSS